MLRVWHIASKDVRVWVRDVAALGILLGMPIVLILILGSAFGGMESGDLRLKVALVNLDAGTTVPVPGAPPTSSVGIPRNIGEELTDVLIGDARLKKVFDVKQLADARVARDRVAQGDFAAAVVVPTDFTARIVAAKTTSIRVYEDPAQQTAAQIAESVVRSITARYSAVSVAVQTVLKTAEKDVSPALLTPQLVGESQGVAIEYATASGALDSVRVKDTQTSPDIQLRALDFYGVSMTAMFLMFGAMFGAFAMVKERREQTLARILASPTNSISITAGKMLGIFILGMLQFLVLYLATRFGFGVRWGDDVAAIFAVAAAEVLSVTGLAVLIASLAKSERGAGALGPPVIQVQALIGGAFFTISVLPAWLQPIRFLSIIGWANEGWSRIQLGGAGITEVMG
ncbi:MAG: ABC transporter permease, partial [Actinobacteria bacterium]